MAKIPRIQPSLRRTTSQSPNSFQRTIGASGQVTEIIGQTLQNAGEVLKKAALVAEKTKAQNERDKQLNDIQLRASNDPDVSEERRQFYDDEIDNAILDSSEAITIPEDRSLFELDSKAKSNILKSRVNGLFMRKTVEAGKASLDIYLTNKKDEFISADNSGAKQTAIIERDLKIQEMQDSGFLTPAEVIKIKDDQRKEWAQSQVEYDISTNPELAKDILDQKAYPGITESERIEFLSDAQSAIKKNKVLAERQQKQIREEKEDELSWKLFDGTLTTQELSDNRDIISGKYAKAMKKALLTPASLETKPKVFLELQDAFVNLEIDEEDETDSTLDKIGEFRISVVEAMDKKEINQSDGKRFLRQVSVAYKQQQEEESKVGIGSKINQVLKSQFFLTWQAINSWADRNADSDDVEQTKMRMQRKVTDDVIANKSPEEGLQKAIQEEKSKINPGPKPEIGEIMTNFYGTKAKVVGFDPDTGSPLMEIIFQSERAR